MASLLRIKLVFCGCLISFLPLSGGTAQEPIELYHRWEFEPDLNCWRRERAAQIESVDLARLGSTVNTFRLSEARKIAGSESQFEPKIKPEAIASIMQALRAGDSNRTMQQAMVSALLKLTDGSELPELWQLTSSHDALRGFVEAALIERQHSAAKSDWLARLADPETVEVDLRLAITGVAAIKAQEAQPQLEALVRSDALALPTKIAATQSLGQLADSGLESLAGELLESQRFAKEQLAANLLVNHSGKRARELMLKILRGPLAPAQVLAYRWCAEHDPELARELAESMLQHPDNSLRLQAVEVLHRDDDPTSLQLQSQLLSDRNPTVRRTVRDHLIEKAEDEALRATVDEALTMHLSGEAFEGMEQAILVVVALKQAERCPQLVQLLEHPRPEVAIRAAWGLQALAESPEDLEKILQHCQRWTDRLVNLDPKLPVEETDVMRLAFAFQALGHNAYQPADEMLRLYVPKNSQRMRKNTRIAAIWALGEIWAGRHDSELEKPLAERMLDDSVIDAEEETVKYVSAIALGKFGNPASLPQLKSAPDLVPTPVGCAVEWAIQQLNGS